MPHVKTSKDKQLEEEISNNMHSLFGSESSFLDYSCWECNLNNGCDPEVHQTILDDGSKISYRWYRFKDQPTLNSLKAEFPDVYTDAYLQALQSKIEEIQANWINKEIDFLSRPVGEADNQFNLVEIDHGLVITPSEPRKLGWVPIVISVEMPGKKWQTELNLLEGGPNSELIQDY
tara:strand:- start:585 stop:1112 length:528 start_codon:yes stop_codon:yes gene_type:complete